MALEKVQVVARHLNERYSATHIHSACQVDRSTTMSVSLSGLSGIGTFLKAPMDSLDHAIMQLVHDEDVGEVGMAPSAIAVPIDMGALPNILSHHPQNEASSLYINPNLFEEIDFNYYAAASSTPPSDTLPTEVPSVTIESQQQVNAPITASARVCLCFMTWYHHHAILASQEASHVMAPLIPTPGTVKGSSSSQDVQELAAAAAAALASFNQVCIEKEL